MTYDSFVVSMCRDVARFVRTECVSIRDIVAAFKDTEKWPWKWPGILDEQGFYIFHDGGGLGSRPLYIGSTPGSFGNRASVHLGLATDSWGNRGCEDIAHAVRWCLPQSGNWLLECIHIEGDKHYLAGVEKELIRSLYPLFNRWGSVEYPFADELPDWLTAMWKKESDDCIAEARVWLREQAQVEGGGQ